MAVTQPIGRMTYEEYLAFEEKSETKHEWVNGEVYAMAGGTLRHSEIAAAVISLLRAALVPRGCRVFTSDARVRVRATDRSTYPDVSVVCEPAERDERDRLALTNPTLIVEVRSDDLQYPDRGDKRHYRRIPSLRTYVLVSTTEPRIEVYTRSGDAWRFADAGPGESIDIGLHDARLCVDAIYDGIGEDDA